MLENKEKQKQRQHNIVKQFIIARWQHTHKHTYRERDKIKQQRKVILVCKLQHIYVNIL